MRFVVALVALGGLASFISPALDRLASTVLLGVVGLVVAGGLVSHAVAEYRYRKLFDDPPPPDLDALGARVRALNARLDRLDERGAA